VCARRRSNFLLAAKRKSPKRRRPPVCVPHSPCRANGGNLRCSVLGWCRRTRCVLRTALKQLRQARSRSACVLRHTHPPQALRFSAQPAGVGSGYHSAAASQLRLESGTRALRAADGLGAISLPRPSAATAHRAERSNGPKGARFHPLLTVPRSAGPGVSACRRTRASSSGSPKLFDRSCLAEAAQGVLRRHPRTEHRRLPPRHRRGGHGQRGRLFLAYLLLTKQKKVGAPPGAHPGLRPPCRHAAGTNNERA